MKKNKIVLILVFIVLITTLIVVLPKKELKAEIELELLNSNNIAYYVQKEDGTYEASNVIPDGYVFSNKSVCTANAFPKWRDGKVKIMNLTSKSTNCFIYFDKLPENSIAVGDIIAKKGAGTPDFSKTSCTNGTNDGGNCEEETVGLYSATTSLGTTYYYRGDVKDNYVEFADHYWRIIRINENGSLRLIYQGRTKDGNGNKLEIQKTGSETQIGESAFNTNNDQAEYVGFKYTLGLVHGTGTKSTILEESLEPWYQENIVAKGLESHIDKESGFCGDRSITSGTGIGTEVTDYGAYTRLVTNKQPTFECPNSEDLYKTGVGLITADEVVYAGDKTGDGNCGYYLYTGNLYWTISPYHFSIFLGAFARVFEVYYGGNLDRSGVSNSSGVRPVINLSTDNLTISGSGTIDSPYVFS